MTFIATIAAPSYTLQVSDRMLSTPAGEFDALANKAMIIGTRCGVVSLAFSGTAFIRDRPTDQRLAEQLTGMNLDQNATTMGDAPVLPGIGAGLRSLIEYLQNSAEWREHRGEIVMAGWQWKLRGRVFRSYRQVVYSIRTPSRTGPLVWRQHIPRHWPDRRIIFLDTSGTDPFTDGAIAPFLERLERRWPTWEEAEEILVDMLRAAADRRPDVIGRNGMSIMLPARAPWEPIVRYHADTEPTAVWLESGDRVPVRYVPWVIHGGVAAGPRVAMAVRSLAHNGITVDVSAPSAGLRLPGDRPRTFVYPLGATQGLDRPLPGGRRILSRDARLLGYPS